MTAPRSGRLVRAHLADVASVEACRAMIDALEAVLAGERVVSDRDAHAAWRETVEHELVRLREAEAEYVDDLLAIESDGGPMCPRDYRAPRAGRKQA